MNTATYRRAAGLRDSFAEYRQNTIAELRQKRIAQLTSSDIVARAAFRLLQDSADTMSVETAVSLCEPAAVASSAQQYLAVNVSKEESHLCSVTNMTWPDHFDNQVIRLVALW